MQLFDRIYLKVDGPEGDSGVSNGDGQKMKTRRTGRIFQPGNPVLVNRRCPDTGLQSREWIVVLAQVVQDPSYSLKPSDGKNMNHY